MNDELISRYNNFELKQEQISESVFKDLGQFKEKYISSYSRLTSLQAWNSYLLQNLMTSDAHSFFIEAQNDALNSHVLARNGMWRSSLQSLRSTIENILVCHYYFQHPVELDLWKQGKHKIGFTALTDYFENHPNIYKHKKIVGLQLLKKEYADLSQAVHGSSISFWMGKKDEMPTLMTSDQVSLGKWETRQKNTLKALNVFMLTFHSSLLSGTAYPALRNAISKSVPQNIYKEIKDNLNINLHNPTQIHASS